MDLKQLKLDLIKAISRCDDPQLLSTLAQVLELEQADSAAAERISTDRPPWQQPDSSETDELQQSIDDIFNPK